jgi:peroxiredoxin
MLLDATAINEIVHSEADNRGIDLVALSDKQPVLIIFLRHFGCTFCREALSDISNVFDTIKDLGVKVIYVHMVDKETADLHLSFHNLHDTSNISDPERRLYEYFGLKEGNFRQLFGLNVMMRGVKAGMINGHGHGFKFVGDGNQMPGMFMLRAGRVVRKFIHQYASDRPNYLEFTEFSLLEIDNEINEK